MAITCNSCNQHIGDFVAQAEGIKLFKPYITSRKDQSSYAQSFDIRKWLACHLLSAIETTGVRKFYAASLPFELWVFSTDITFASSSNDSEPTRAVKVLFRDTDTSTLNKRDELNSQQLHIEELGLPQALESDLFDVLKKANHDLPHAARNFLDWKVALLPRFVEADT